MRFRLVAVALLAVACTSPAEPETAPTQAEAEPVVTEEATPSPEAASSASEVPSEAIATTAGELPGLILEVVELRRTGEAVTLTFALVNEGEQNVVLGNSFLRPTDGTESFYSVAGVTLTDDVNSRRHLVLREPDGVCVCSINVEALGAGQRGLYFAKFPAPPEDVGEMSVEVPNFPAVDGIAVTG